MAPTRLTRDQRRETRVKAKMAEGTYTGPSLPPGVIRGYEPQAQYLLDASGIGAIFSQTTKSLEQREMDPAVKKALIKQLNALVRQLDEWVKLAEFAKKLSIGLAIGAGALCLFLLSAMTWGDLFDGASLWELCLLLFSLAIFVASPLAIFVIGRPLKGLDEWSPTRLMRPE